MKNPLLLLLVIIFAVLACLQPLLYSVLVELTKDYETNFEPSIKYSTFMLGLLFGLFAYAILSGCAAAAENTEDIDLTDD